MGTYYVEGELNRMALDIQYRAMGMSSCFCINAECAFWFSTEI